MGKHRYSEKKVLFVKNNLQYTWADIANMFNAEFHTAIDGPHLKAAMRHYGIKNHSSKQNKEVGIERDRSGYIEVKTSKNPSVWKLKHILLWEEAHGKLPKNWIVLFADKNTRNFDIDNLIAVPRGVSAAINSRGNYYNADSLKCNMSIAKIRSLIKKRRKVEGKKHTPEHCQKISEAMKGYYELPENRRKKSEAMKKYYERIRH